MEVKLNSGGKIPRLGVGTWKVDKKNVGDVIEKAVKIGYRHIDCASVYGNEKEVGVALDKLMNKEKVVKREELFITSKLWNTHHGCVEEACRQSLKHLQVDYLDLYLVHWPCAFKFTGMDLTSNPIAPVDSTGRVIFEKVTHEQTWKEMEKLVEKGLVKSIGLSNFTVALVTDLMCYCKIPPSVNQIECHIFHQRGDLANEMNFRGIAVQGYSPLGSHMGIRKTLEDESLKVIAENHSKTPAQIALRWAIERGQIVIARTTNEDHMKENFNIFDFQLTKAEKLLIKKKEESKSYLGDFVFVFLLWQFLTIIRVGLWKYDVFK